MTLEYNDILDMKEVIYSGIPQTAIAQQFFVDKSTVSKICRGHLYPEVPWPNGQTGGLNQAEYRKIRFERKQSEASSPLNESSLETHFTDDDASVIEGASRLLDQLGIDSDDIEFDHDEPLDPDDPDLDNQLAGATFGSAIRDPIKELERIRQEKLISLRKQREAIDELGQEAARQLDKEIDEIAIAVGDGEVHDARERAEKTIFDGWDWDEVTTRASKVKLVKLIESDPDRFDGVKHLKTTVGIVLRATPEHQWDAERTTDMILSLSKEIRDD